MSNKLAISQQQIENRIFTIRYNQVMIDRDLAEMYQVETKVLNQAVKRNIDRFPELYRFHLTENKKTELVTNCDRFRFLNSHIVTSNSRSQNVTLNQSGSKQVYHLGASLKDLGKRWFAFSKLEAKSVEGMMNEIKELI